MNIGTGTSRNTGPRSKVALAAAVVMTAAVALVVPVTSVAAAPAPSVAAAAGTHLVTFDGQMIVLINRARAAAGVAPVLEARGLDQLAVFWSAQLDAGKTAYALQHNPNAWTSVLTYGASNRTAWGENVAWSSSTVTTAQQLFTAYMNSAGHRANILSRSFHFVGMGTVAGTHGLFNTTEFTDAVQPGQAIGGPPVNGDFIRDAGTGATYRLVGGAPIFVSSWTPFGGAKPFKLVTHAKLVSMPVYPANGTFLRTASGHQVYKIVGGAPQYVTAWSRMGGVHPTVDVDPAAVTHAGLTGYWAHLRKVPVDGTFIRASGTGTVYRMAGGAPIYVPSWTAFGGTKATQVVDASVVSHASRPGVWAHLRTYPANSTYLKPAGSTVIYRVISGAARPFSTTTATRGVKAYVIVHPLAITRAGTGGFYNHLKK